MMKFPNDSVSAAVTSAADNIKVQHLFRNK